jgi:hypothetical protein
MAHEPFGGDPSRDGVGVVNPFAALVAQGE